MAEILREIQGLEAERAPESLPNELIRLLADQARRVVFPLAMSSCFMAALVMTYVNVVYPLIWLAAVVLSTLVHTRTLDRLLLPHISEDRKLTTAAWSFAIHGAALSALLAAFPYVPVTIGAMFSMYSIGLCAATIPATAGYPRIFLPYALVTLLPVALAWGFTSGLNAPTHERAIVIAMLGVFIVTMLGHAKGAYAVFVDSYNIRLQRIRLIDMLSDALRDAETASRAKTRFLASASHDLRQPMHALSLFSGSLRLRQLEPRTRMIADQIDKAVVMLSSQLDALLDISRLDAGVIETSLAPVALAPMLGQLKDEFLPQADKKGLRLKVSCPTRSHVLTDAQLLLRILRNLVSNAIKYTEEGQVEIAVKPVGQRVEIAIHDSGVGVAEAEHEKIFEEFYQINNPERDRSKGLGLGLAIVRRLTDLLAIDLRMESRSGCGSTFAIEMDAAADQSEVDLGQELDELPTTAIDVLVIDDEEVIRIGMRTLLEEMGFSVRLSASTEEAVKLAKARMPAIVLADIRLRGTDSGMQAINSLRAMQKDLPAILISGDTAPARLREAHDAGLLLLHKPVSYDMLKESIFKSINP